MIKVVLNSKEDKKFHEIVANRIKENGLPVHSSKVMNTKFGTVSQLLVSSKFTNENVEMISDDITDVIEEFKLSKVNVLLVSPIGSTISLT